MGDGATHRSLPPANCPRRRVVVGISASLALWYRSHGVPVYTVSMYTASRCRSPEWGVWLHGAAALCRPAITGGG